MPELEEGDKGRKASPPSTCQLLANLVKALWPVLVLVAATAIAAILVRHKLLELCEWLDDQDQATAAFLFLSLFIVWVVLWLPASVLELASGFIFGLGWGGLINTAGKFLGGMVCFVVCKKCRFS